jgi:hypothetical protein
MSEKIIFLDFDGPLSNPRVVLYGGYDNALDPVAVTALNNVCSYTGAKIVCTSTRTAPHSAENYAETQALLEAAGLDLRHLHQDWSCFYDMDSPRKTHIKKWLHAHPQVKHYAIIDDEAVGMKNMIRVGDMDGLQIRHFEKLARLLDFRLCDVFNHARNMWYGKMMAAKPTDPAP